MQATILASELLSLAADVIAKVQRHGRASAPAWLREAAATCQVLNAWLARVEASKQWETADLWYEARGAFFFPDLTLHMLYYKALSVFDSKSG